MPDSYGKRNRDMVKARKAAARDERRVARNQRQREREITGGTEPDGFADPPTGTEDAGDDRVPRGA